MSGILRIINACITGTHANQILLTRKKGEGDDAAFASNLADTELEALVAAHGALLADPETKTAELEQLERAGLELAENLPVSLMQALLAEKAPDLPEEKAKAMASLIQLALEVDRDGTVLQDMFRLFKERDALVSPSEIGLEDDNAVFLGVGERLAPQTCACPFESDAAAWQINFRKLENWNIKHRGIATAATLADEILAWPAVSEARDGIAAMSAQRVLVIGHSFSMWVNWSTYDSFTNITNALISSLNSGFEFLRIGEGGMTAARAHANYFEEGLAWQPDRVIFVCVIRSDEDFTALEEMAIAFKKQGAEVICFDRLHPDAESYASPHLEGLQKLAADTGVTILEVGAVLDAHPERESFVCLDGIHCRTNYHKIMAGELTRFLAGARAAAL